MEEEAIVATVCTADIPISTLNSIRAASQNFNTAGPPSVIVLDRADRERIQQLTRDSTTQGHVDEGFVSPFVGMTPTEVVHFVAEKAQRHRYQRVRRLHRGRAHHPRPDTATSGA
ncbi:uncharacterized protein BO72DRAFT_492243 [Aspergillus fijiensis CBS 313.89]|uniref:Uncharacterized protein n=1 Tax=Aspergillus fijiensis CBS 313.89 TaxID=1448319 RepID=A0A8G1RWN1_9EURO|nr:uncharacterized protein BO72DRAFT_492243 [Aspergillus fijiensis CBS 313.89]RAK81412.1 hypothetical protein BO72DRAFT_492243 [Aspergillus fijiensis CBS 313.89]